MTVAAVLIFAAALIDQYQMLTATVEVPGGVVQGVSGYTVRVGATYAAPTLAFWIVLYLVVDRFRPQRPVVWFLALGWGACAATWLAININTWAAAHLSVAGDGDPASSARAAIFIAPFVEEGAKATVLFWLAILARYRLTSKVSLITLGGLSAAGFAFTENIIYYARALMYATSTIDVGDADAAIHQLVMMRGVYTAFGHPLFTMVTATGVAIALRTRSKVVRVLAPLAAYLGAALLHMLFNSQTTLQSADGQVLLYITLALPAVVAAAAFVIWQEIKQSRRIRARLGDYVRMGWLDERDPVVFSRLRSRFHALAIALTRGWTCWLATVRLQRAMTELAYLRESETIGLVDGAAVAREHELLAVIRAARAVAVADPRGQHLNLPKLRLPGRRSSSASLSSGNFQGWRPAGQGGTPATGYSAVDPSWGPPPG